MLKPPPTPPSPDPVVGLTAVPNTNAKASPASAEIPAIDGFRALAATVVVIFHCWLWTGRGPVDHALGYGFAASGHLGVVYFFAISGFVLFLPAALREGSFGNIRSYALRRVARIVPAYYLSLLVALLLRPFVLQSGAVAQSMGLNNIVPLVVAAHLSFLQGFLIPQNNQGFGVYASVWTLTIEATFYIVLPLVAGMFFRRPLLGLLIAFLIAGIWDYTVGKFFWPMTFQLPSFAEAFAMGMAVAWLYARWVKGGGRRYPVARWLPVFQAGALALLLGLAVADGLTSARLLDVAAGVAFTLLMAATIFGPSWAQWPVSNVVSRWIGTISYGIYLFHVILIKVVLTVWPSLHNGTTQSFLVVLAIIYPTVLVVGWLSYRFLEQPLRRRARTLARKWQSADAQRQTRVTAPAAAGSGSADRGG